MLGSPATRPRRLARHAAALAAALVAVSALGLGAACDEDTSTPPAPQWAPAWDAAGSGILMNVFDDGAGTWYAVGGTYDDGALFTAPAADGPWSEVDLSRVGQAVPLLNWGHALSADDIWLVGQGGTLLHFDGAAWSAAPSPTMEDLWGVWGAASGDVWAVGGGQHPGPGEPTMLRYDGVEWTRVETPELTRQNVMAFFKVWGSGADDVWVVGSQGVVLRWDGAGFTEEFVGANGDLIALWGTGPDRVAMAGGRNNGQLVTFDGTDFKATDLAPVLGLNGVWMDDSDVIHAVGVEGTLLRIDLETHEVTADTPLSGAIDSDFALHAVHGDATEGALVAVGGTLLLAAVAGRFEGLALTRPLLAGELP